MLDAYLESPPGQIVSVIGALDYALQAGVTLTLKDITYPQFLWLRLLAVERGEWEKEEMKKRG